MNGHRLTVAAESILLGLRTPLFFLVFGPLMATGVFHEFSGLGLTMLLVVLLSAIALVCFWRVAFAFVFGTGRVARTWWWGTSIGVLLVLGSAVVVAIGALGLEVPEALVSLAFGAYGAPILVPLIHMWLVREQF